MSMTTNSYDPDLLSRSNLFFIYGYSFLFFFFFFYFLIVVFRLFVRIYWPAWWTVFPKDCFCLDWRGTITIINFFQGFLTSYFKICWFKLLLFFTKTLVFLFTIFFLTRCFCCNILFIWTFFFFFFLLWVLKFFILICLFIIHIIIFSNYYNTLTFVLFFLVILFYLYSFLS